MADEERLAMELTSLLTLLKSLVSSHYYLHCCSIVF